MNPPDIEAAIEELKARLAEVEGVEAAILFGSAARGNATRDSDVDVLIVTSPECERAVLEVVWEIEGRLPVRFSTLFSDGDFTGMDSHLLESFFRDGKVLLGELPPLTVKDLGLEPVRLVKYHMRGLPPSEKMKVYRFLDGYATKKRRGQKEYSREVRGFLTEVGGWRVGRGAIVVPESAVERLDRFFRTNGVKRSMVGAWIPRP